jgi:integrase
LQILKYGYLERPYMFNRMMAVLKAAWAWGQEAGMIDSQVACPANTVQLYEEKKRDRYLDSAELERLLDEVSKLERKDAANAIYLLIFTGARRSEILDLRWEEIDWEGSVAVLRDSKTGPGKAVYLNADAIQLLEWMRPTYGSGVRLHDLRHTFASVGLKSGLSLEEISKLLGHSDLRVTQRYAHMNNKQLLKAVDTVGTAIRSK